MSAFTNAKLISIGNSRGVRIPKRLLEQSGLTENVEMIAEKGRVVIRSAREARQGWEQEFSVMAATGDDALLELTRLARHPHGRRMSGNGN